MNPQPLEPKIPAFESMTVRAFLDLLAAKTPAPGGGAAASIVGAVSASLAAMVVNYSIGKKSLSQHVDALGSSRDRLKRASDLMMRLADEDAAAYGLVNELSRLPDGDGRKAADLPAAQAAAVQIPLAVMAACVDLLMLYRDLAVITNRQLRSDLGIAGVLAAAACESSWWNVAINAGFVADERQRASWMAEARAMREQAMSLGGEVEAACEEE
ncbi:MAG: hypothetical protein GIKADHBN_01668 [Phycisphaerales bacterium]|nr:hypothetical protein [Phycisphaerales bacterium]